MDEADKPNKAKHHPTRKQMRTLMGGNLRAFLVVLLVGVVFFVVFARYAKTQTPVPEAPRPGAPVYGSTLRWHSTSNPPMIDPHFTTDDLSTRISSLLFETLAVPSEDGQEILPLLAESWSVSHDGLVWVFKLRQGVRFHNGREVTADDWVWSFERMIRDNSPRAYFLDMVAGYDAMAEGHAEHWAGVRAKSPYELEFTLSYPFAPFLSVLTYHTFSVLPREEVERWGKAFNFHPVGTGPFSFGEWKQDQFVSLPRNPDYWGRDEKGNQLPYLDAFELVIIPDSSVAYEEFKQGNLDVLSLVPNQIHIDARKRFPERVMEWAVPVVSYFGFNMQRPPFANNEKLRQAFNYALNRPLISEVIMNGRGIPASGVIPPGILGYDPDLVGYPYDKEKARALLVEAGYPNGFECTLQVNANVIVERLSEAVQAQLADCGITIKLRVVDWGVHIDTLDRGEADFFRMAWIADYPDPDNFLYVNLHSANAGAKGNYAFYSNPQVDKLLDAGRRETDPAKRVELYREAQRIVVAEAPWLFLFYGNAVLLHGPRIEGLAPSQGGPNMCDLRGVWTW